MKLFIFTALLIFSWPLCAQINLFVEGSYGPQKTMLAIHGEKVFNPLVQVGVYAKTGSLSHFDYRDINYELDNDGICIPTSEVPEFPYAHDAPDAANNLPEVVGSARLLSAETRISGGGAGAYLCLSRELGRYAKDWFFIRFSAEYLWLSDNYKLLWGTPGMDSQNAVEQSGTYRFDAIGYGTQAGYKRFLDREDRLFIQANLGVSWFYPYYRDGFSNGGFNYSFSAPFVGVEFIGGLGVGYTFGRKLR